VILASPERIEAVRAAADAITPAVLDLTAQIAAVPSPTGEESQKSILIERLFADAGLAIERDELGTWSPLFQDGFLRLRGCRRC
jgi:hypothetical protein